jgi:hypothetical protein
MLRRDFVKIMGVSVGSASLHAAGIAGAASVPCSAEPTHEITTIRGAFLYPPTQELEKKGYYSWPGSDFDAEGRQKQYMSRIRDMEKTLSIRIDMDEKPLDTVSEVDEFIARTTSAHPNGLLLIPLKKSPHWEHVVRIVEEAKIPTVILATLGVLQGSHVRQVIDRPGVYMINSPDNLEAVESGLRMIRTGVRLRQARIINIDGAEAAETTVPFVGTTIRKIPHQRFYELFAQAQVDDQVKELAGQFTKQAVKIVHPSAEDILQAAKTYFVLKRILAEENGDALMMNCLPGLAAPHKHVPPCMGFMRLMNEGIAMGCESDLDGTLTMMLLQELCGKPGFLHNAALDTENNHYWGAHCTSPSKMNGVDGQLDSYELMSHCESGWGTVPRVLFKEGQEVTLTRYLSWPPQPISAPTIESRASRAGVAAPEKPQLLLYSGKVVGCPPIPPAGGCRTNVEIDINELNRATDLIGNHMVMVYGDHVKQLRQFCQLHDILVAV